MEQRRGKYVAPTVKETRFSCPYCGTLAAQPWFYAHAERISFSPHVPTLRHEVDGELVDKLANASSYEESEIEKAQRQLERQTDLVKKRMFLGSADSVSFRDSTYAINNLHFSVCSECKNISIWKHDTLLYPETHIAPEPNEDMPDDVLRDYEEANSILVKSPRGAAALLRLSIEKICGHLGHGKKKINTAIKDMVANGLPIQIQQALDTVRVVGNEAVHPGTLDIKDNREVALKLFGLVNIIVEDRISRPRKIAALYEDIVPENKREEIKRRDAKKADD